MQDLAQRAAQQSKSFDFIVFDTNLTKLATKVKTMIDGLDAEGHKAEAIGEPESIQPCAGKKGPFIQKVRFYP